MFQISISDEWLLAEIWTFEDESVWQEQQDDRGNLNSSCTKLVPGGVKKSINDKNLFHGKFWPRSADREIVYNYWQHGVISTREN